MDESGAGPDQVIVTYESGDNGGFVSPASLIQEQVAPDAARRYDEGWVLVSTSVCAIRQVGTAGNFLFQSGGQFATQLAAVVVYRRR